MTYKNFGRALTLLAAFGFVACGGSTTLNFVGESDGSGGLGGNDGDGGSKASGGLGGDGSGGKKSTGGTGGTVVLGYCGDGIIDTGEGEDCDDGNERSRDGCSSACAVEPPFVCSGEPSVCFTCGNGTLDAGEGCDDGNSDDGDGCSAECTVEGTCAEPVAVQFEDTGLGPSVAVVKADTSAGGGTNEAQACNGLSLGAGDDRTYLVELTQASDLSVTVEAEFDAIVRIYGSYAGSTCEPDYEAFCIDDAGAGETETFHYRRMPGVGVIIVSVDGAEEGEAGEFTLTVTQGCDSDHVKLHRLTPFFSGGNTETVSLKNTSDYCTVNLDQVGFAVTDDVAPGPMAVDLPARPLGPGQVFRGSFDVVAGVNENSFDFEELPRAFNYIAAGAYVCDGPCDLDSGTNVTDGVLTRSGTATILEVPGTAFLPGVLTFDTAGFTPYHSYVRVAYDGAWPDFLASDWSLAFLIDPDDYTVDGFAYYPDGENTLPPLSLDSDPTEGAVVSVAETAGVLAGGVYSTYGVDIPSAVGTATYISYKVRTGSQESYGCYTAFGTNNGSLGTSDGWGSSAALNYGVRVGSSNFPWHFLAGGATTAPSDVWHTVELENIDWTTHTFDIRYDGALFASGVSMNDTALPSVTLFSVMPHYAVDCHYSDIIVRNGPPGRIWESPPVLVAPD